jgi:hypothetical protein
MAQTVTAPRSNDEPEPRIPVVRISPDAESTAANLGLLHDLAGTWEGCGFNLVGRPDHEANTNVFLELNLTKETLRFEPIASSIPNRGFAQDDIELFGLTYLQKISDLVTGGALHIEPGIWVRQPATSAPAESAPAGQQIVARMGSIPHGNAILAQGTAATFSGPPTLSSGGGNPAFSVFPSFNSTPFAVSPQVIRAAGTAETSAPAGGFSEYTLSNATSSTNTRTPQGNVPPILPPEITQELVNDPILFLQRDVQRLLDTGHSFEGTVLNIATQSPIEFLTTTDSSATGPTVSVSVTDAAGGIANTPFLTTNAQSALVYATFWIERVTHPKRRPFMQLQYAQMVLLNFPAALIPGQPNFSWPHVSVATLLKTFG